VTNDEKLARIRRIVSRPKITVDDATAALGLFELLDFDISTGGPLPRPWTVAVRVFRNPRQRRARRRSRR